MPATLAGPPAALSGLRPARFTRDQYHDMGQRGCFHGQRVERIRGEISPINWPHALATTCTADVLRRALVDIGWVHLQNPLTLPVTDSDPEPDVAVYPGTFRDYSDHPTAAQALLVVEVADTTLQYDLTVKAKLYAEEGIREYWVLDVNARQLHVLRDPAPIPAGDHHYCDRRILGEQGTITPLLAPTATLRVADLLT